MTLEQLEVKISANAKEFDIAMTQVQKQLQSLNSTTEQVSKNMGGNLSATILKANVASQILVAGIGKVFGGIKKLSSEIYNQGSAYTRMSTATKVLTRNMGISDEQVQGLRDSLADANTMGVHAERTIKLLAQSGLMQFAQNISLIDARTGEAIKGVGGLIIGMKDLAAASMVRSDEAIEGLTRFIQSGIGIGGGIDLMLSGVSNLSLEYKAWGQQMGITGRQLTAQEQQMARMDIVVREAEKNVGAYAASYQEAGKIMESVKMITILLQGKIGAALSPMFNTFALGLYELLSGFRDGLSSTTNWLESFAIRVSGVILAVFRTLGKLLSRLPIIGKYFAKLANLQLKVLPPLKSMDKLGNSAGDGLEDAAKGAKDLNKELAGLAGFDEMNVLKEASESEGSIGSAGISNMGADFSVPEGSMFEAGLTQEQIDRIEEGAKKIEKFFEPIINFILKYSKPLMAIVGIFTTLGVVLVGLLIGAKVFGAIQTALTFLGSILAPIVALFGAISAPMLIAVAVVAALVAGFIYMYNTSEAVRTAVQQLGETARNALSKIWVAAQPVIEIIKTGLTIVVKKLGEMFSWLWTTVLKPLIEKYLVNLIDGFKLGINVITEVIIIVLKVAEVLLNFLIPHLKTLWEVASTVFKAIGSVVAWLWNNMLKPYLQNIWNFITGFIVPVLQTLGIVFAKIFNALADKARDAWNGIKNAISPVTNWIQNNVLPIIQKIADKFAEVWSGVKSSMSGVWEGVSGSIKTGINWIIGHLRTFRDKINSLLEGASNLATSVGGKAITYRIPQINYLARGGVIESPTMAMLGESGREVVMPLENNTGWIDELASKLNKGSGQTLIVKLGEEDIYSKFIDFINDKTMSSNTQLLKI